MPALAERLEHSRGQARFWFDHATVPEARTWLLDGLLQGQAEIKVLHHGLYLSLENAIAAGGAEREDRLALPKRHAGGHADGQRASGLRAVGARRIGIRPIEEIVEHQPGPWHQHS